MRPFDRSQSSSRLRVALIALLAVVSTVGAFGSPVAAAGRIEGSVTAADPDQPSPFALVAAFDTDGDLVLSERVPTDYSIELPAGQYYMAAGDDLEINLVGELYPEIPCLGPPFDECPITTGQLVTVVDDGVVTDIDFTLDSGGAITGTVTRSTGGSGVFDVVRVYDSNGDFLRETPVSEDDRTYRVDGLLSGTYFALAELSTVFDPATDRQLYRDRPCEICDPLEGDPIEVVLGEVVTEIDFTFDVQASIRIEVVDAASGERLPAAERAVYDTAGRPVTEERVAPGRYYAAARADGYRPTAFDGVTLSPGSLDPSEIIIAGTPIDLANGDDRVIEIALDAYGVIAGRLVSPEGEPLAGQLVQAYGLESEAFVAGAVTGAEGRYEVPTPPEPSLLAVSFETTALPYTPQLWPNVPCVDVGRVKELCPIGAASPLTVELGGRLDLGDFTATPEAVLVVRAEDALTGTSIDSFSATLFLESGEEVESRSPSALQTFRRLPQGGYRLLADAPGFVPSAFGAASCGAACGVLAGEVVDLVEGETREIVVRLFRPADQPSLLLRDDRFRIDVRWSDFEGGGGEGIGEPLSNESGSFWFFADDNIELVIKVIDACDAFDRYWVFAAGLTNVAVEIDVTDTLDGTTVSYESPLGTSFEPVLDIDAFDSCLSGGVPVTETATSPAHSAGPKVGEPLTLRGGRFIVTADWQDFDGNAGAGTGDNLTQTTGTFWFFDPANVEVIVKVLDACEAFDRYWVFAAGLTNVDVTLTVRDTLASGEEATKTYRNPLGEPYQPILDVDAFATCP